MNVVPSRSELRDLSSRRPRLNPSPTAGDGLADNEYAVKGTITLLADTDRDGYADNVDLFPLADAFVQVLVVDVSSSGTDDMNDGTSGLEPFVAVTYTGERTYTKNLDNTGVTDQYCSFNIPDDAASASLKVDAWDYDADNSHDPINVAATNSTTLTYATGDYIGWFQWFDLSGTTDPRVVNLPRSVFFDTYLSTRLNAAGNMTGWLADAANHVQFSQNASDGPDTAALDATLTADLDVAEWTAMINALTRNTMGNLTQTYIRVDWEPSVGDFFFLLGLPDAIVQLASYEPLPNTASQTYVFDYRPLWQRIWEGAIAATLEWIASGFVAAINFLVHIGEALAQLGAWLWSAIVGAAQAVASAVQAAAEAVGQFVDWIVTFARQVLNELLAPLFDFVKAYLDGVRAGISDAFREFEGNNLSPEEHAEQAAELMLALFVTGSLLIFAAIVFALAVAEVILTPWVAMARVILPLIRDAIIVLIGAAIGIALFPVPNATPDEPSSAELIPNQVIDFVPSSVWWNARVPFVIARFLSTLTFLIVGKAGLSLRTAVSVAVSFASLVLFFLGPQFPGDLAAFAAVVSLAFALAGLLLATTSALKHISPVVWTVSVALAVLSMGVAVVSIFAGA